MTVEDYTDLKCDNSCPHCDPLNSFCWRLWIYIRPYDKCHGGFTVDENGVVNYGTKET